MEDFTCLLKFPERLDGGSISQLEVELREIGMSMADVYHVGDVPEPAPYDKSGEPYVYTFDGAECIFCGTPPEGFDFEFRLRTVFEDAFVSKGTNYQTGERLWIVRTSPLFPEKSEENMRRLGADVIAAMAFLNMHKMCARTQNGVVYSSKSREKKPGLKDLLREAKSNNIRNCGIFYSCGGVPYRHEAPLPFGFRVHLVEGTEVLAEGDLTSELKKLQGKYQGMAIHPVIPIGRRVA